ncbi:hypothetical protein K502DRAFT_209825 [Neoconidiobolus thromboides FSU 785]|nr:hypothetical protein K502DRAFT_209825 [Neoconidiobolus thromboides FSU 785]
MLELNSPFNRRVYGYLILIVTYIIFLVYSYALFFSKYITLEPEYEILTWIRENEYYFLASILFLPMGLWIIFWNWAGMKYFRHN